MCNRWLMCILTDVLRHKLIFLFFPIMVHPKLRIVKGCSHGAITTPIYFSQLMSCMGFSLGVAIASCEHLNWTPHNPFLVIKNRSHDRTVWTVLYSYSRLIDFEFPFSWLFCVLFVPLHKFLRSSMKFICSVQLVFIQLYFQKLKYKSSLMEYSHYLVITTRFPLSYVA